MTIDSSWLYAFKEDFPQAFTKKGPFQASAVFVDGQIKLMQAPPSEPQSWDAFIQRQFGRHLEKCMSTCDTVVLAFDNYEFVPRAKSMTQSQRRRHVPAISFSERSELPCMVPEGDRWTQCIANRTFKTRVIELVLLRLPGLLLTDRPKRRLVVDYHQPVEYRFDQSSRTIQRETLWDLPAMGEADVKFTRHADRYGKLMVDSIDGDSIPIALLHHELCLRRSKPPPMMSVYRMELKMEKQTEAPKRSVEGKPKKNPRPYEFVNVHALYEGLRGTIAQCLGRIQMPSHTGHEMAMLIALISMTGTDFSRNLPQLSGKSVYTFLPDIWPTLAMAYDPAHSCLQVDKALNYLASLLYKTKFPRHVTTKSHASLAAVLSDLQESSMSERIKRSLPTAGRIECTVRNTNWVLAYWTCEPAPNPIQPGYGFRELPGGLVEYDEPFQ